MADIQHMYNRIKIPVTDRDAFRFLWCNDNKLVHYRMTCLVFGGIFCASASAYALNQTAQLTQNHQVQDVIINNFYVDDLGMLDR